MPNSWIKNEKLYCEPRPRRRLEGEGGASRTLPPLAERRRSEPKGGKAGLMTTTGPSCS